MDASIIPETSKLSEVGICQYIKIIIHLYMSVLAIQSFIKSSSIGVVDEAISTMANLIITEINIL